MHYVYLIQSESFPRQKYVGHTKDLKRRLKEHNSGHSTYTSSYTPWKIVTYLAFQEKAKALAFEKYLKSGSGHAFAHKRLW